jgi:putative nucleotidyltransferase with HDIG domain
MQARPHVTPDGALIPLSVSVGHACFPADGRSRQELIAVADHAMYAAKRGAGHESNTARAAERWQDLGVRDAADLLGESPFGVLDGLVNAVDAKDRYTRLHSEHVTQLALALAAALGLSAEQRRVLSLAGPLHDVGKIALPDRILRKPGALTAEEYAAITRHVTYGVAIIRGVLDDAAVIDAVAYHHERWDGRGYPHGLAGPQTPLLGRIMQVADAASAMSLDRPYRKGLPWEQIVAALRAGAGTQFDPALVEPFIAAMEQEQRRTA